MARGGQQVGSDGEVLEKIWQGQVDQAARLHGWVGYHVPISKMVTTWGYPDSHYLHRSRPWHLFAELKRHDGKLSPQQYWWLERLTGLGVACYVWVCDRRWTKPEVWEEVNRVLRQGPCPAGHTQLEEVDGLTRWPYVAARFPHIVKGVTPESPSL